MLRKLMALLLVLAPAAAFGQLTEVGKSTVVITNADISGTTYWSNDNIYELDGFVYVEDGEVLIIEAGTIVKGNPGQGAGATALIVARGGKIYAQGTPELPIIFTSVSDNLDNPNDIPNPPAGDGIGKGLWGGVILLGRASMNDPQDSNFIEGLPAGDARNAYGGGAAGDDDEDNSGVMKYVSIRYAGSNIGANNEINGLTMGGVGRGTVISHIEVFANLDDGYEWFGGTVLCKYLVAAYGGDDGMDYDEGWRGAVQYAFVVADTGSEGSERGGEHDGGGQRSGVDDDVAPFATPNFANATYIGGGADQAKSGQAVELRDNAGVAYFNSLFVNWSAQGIRVEDVADSLTSDSRERLSVGDLVVSHSSFFGNTGGTNSQTWVADSVFGIAALNNDSTDPGITGIDFAPTGGLDPRPTTATASTGDPTTFDPPANPGLNAVWAGFFDAAAYRGAFDPAGDLWTDHWTNLSYLGFTPTPPAKADCQTAEAGKPVEVVTNADITGTTWFSCDTVYNLDGFVYVEDGEVLIIEPGTVIKGNPGQGAGATALVVARGGQVYATGTLERPIIFTAITDNVDNPADVPLPPAGDGLGKGLWGGVILLGRASINDPQDSNFIEGLPSGDFRNAYGGGNAGNDDDDNSGVVKSVSIRHAGSNIGANNEINGLTLGGVGRATTIEYVEVFANLDDGFEWFGGTAFTKYLIAAFGGDDAFDYDEGWRGAGQFWFCIVDTGAEGSERGGEHDGGGQRSGVDDDVAPFATPNISNATYVGGGVDQAKSGQAIELRDNAGGQYANSIFTNFPAQGVRIEDVADPLTGDSRERLSVGDLSFKHNIFWDNQSGEFRGDQPWVRDSVFGIRDHGNKICDPFIGGIDFAPNALLDPRPFPGGPADGGWIDPATYDPPANPGLQATWATFFHTVDYKGAFDPNTPILESWAKFSFISCGGFLGDNPQPPVACTDCALTTDDGKPVEPLTNADIGSYTRLSKDTVYNLSGFVYVEDGEYLDIEEGTIIKGNPGQGAGATALIVARGGFIEAVGTECEPIVMTAITDDVDDAADVPLPPAGDGLGKGLWGGFILLGEAAINDPQDSNFIEGLPSGDFRNAYGGGIAGDNDDDNSGTIKYVSIRHAGSNIGANNEINGLTMGGVGRGTIIENIEVFANLDDGYEWFGGTAFTKNLVAAFGGDDAFDYDEGWRGAGQFWFCIVDTGAEGSERGGEHDGGGQRSGVDDDVAPFATPNISNATYIGDNDQAKAGQAVELRDNAGGAYWNSIFANFPAQGLRIEDVGDSLTSDSRERLSVGDLYFENNSFFGNAGGTNSQAYVADSVFAIAARANDSTDQMLGLISFEPDGQNDPRPEIAGPADGSWNDPSGFNPPANPGLQATWATFFATVTYKGAFDPAVSMDDAWTANWTFVDCGGYLGDARGTMGCCVGTTGDVNCDGSVGLPDLSTLIDHLFITFSPLCCVGEGDVNADGSVGLPDLSTLIDNLFITFSPLPPCL